VSAFLTNVLALRNWGKGSREILILTMAISSLYYNGKLAVAIKKTLKTAGEV
jgi:hypothetical protein